MKCFENWVGLKYCGSLPSLSGYYINSQAGISLKNIDSLANEDQLNFAGIWADIQERALLKLDEAILSNLNQHIRVYKNENLIFGQYNEIVSAGLGSNFKGKVIEAYLNEFQHIQINSVEIYSFNGVSTLIKIYNLNSRELLKEVQVDLVVGYNKVNIDFRYVNIADYKTYIFVCYDSTQVNTTTAENHYNVHNCNVSFLPSFNVYSRSTSDYINFNEGNNGLILNFSLGCSIDNWVCSMRTLFTQSLINLLCAEIHWERIVSTRLSNYTVNQATEKTEAIYKKYLKDYNDSIALVFTNMAIPESQCFSANLDIQTRYIRP